MTTRVRRVLKISLAALAGLVLVAVIAGILVARSDWFREYVRTKIIQTVEESTVGKVEIAQFRFDWRRLHAEVDNFVLHGTEPAEGQPLFRTRQLTVDLKFLSVFRKKVVDIAALTVREPQANVIVFPDGSTNVPRPNVRKPSDKTALKTIVDLAIGRFNIENGSATVSERKTPFSAQGQNLRVQLAFEFAGQRYRGNVTLNPLFVQSGANPKLDVNVNLPVLLERDKITLYNAVLSTPDSRIEISGSLDHLLNPQISARGKGQVDLAETRRALGLSLPISSTPDVPHKLDVDVAFDAPGDQVRLSSAKLSLGNSSLQASGTFANTAFDQGSVKFNSSLALDELTRLLRLSVSAVGTVKLNGNATLDRLSGYLVDATVDAPNLTVQSGSFRVANASVRSRISADQRVIRASALRLSVAGGQFAGSAELVEFARYQLTGTLSRFDVQEFSALATSRRIRFGGTFSGPVEASGNLKTPGTQSLAARARLTITPNNKGIPLRGELNSSYDGRADSIDVGQSFIAMPSSRVDFSGSLGNQIALHLTSRNLDDFLPALEAASTPHAQLPIRLSTGGAADLQATLMGKLSSPVIAGHLSLNRFQAGDRPFDQLSADFNASESNVAIMNGALTNGPLRADLQASVGLAAWKTLPASPLKASAAVRNADVLDVLALAARGDIPARGALTFTAQASGTVGDPQGNADLVVLNGEAYGEPIDRLAAHIDYGGRRITVPSLELQAGMAQLRANASFDHPFEDFSNGTLRAHVDGNQIALARLKTIRERRADLDGSIQLNLDAEASLELPTAASRLQLTSVKGTFNARNLRMNQKDVGDLNAKVDTTGKQVQFDLQSNFAGSNVRATGRTILDPDYSTAADVVIANLPIEQALALAGQQKLAAKGLLSLRGQVAGTVRDPKGSTDVEVTRAEFEDQPIDRLEGHVDYAAERIEVSSMEIRTGANQVRLAGSFQHPRDDFSTGDLRAYLETNSLQLAQIKTIQTRRPGVSGVAQVALDVAGALRKTEPRISLSTLNARTSITALRMDDADYGNLTASAEQSGSTVKLNLDSSVAQAQIKGTGDLQLTRDYPMNVELSFTNVRYSNLDRLLNRRRLSSSNNFDALVEGSVKFAGPAARPENLTGTAQLSKVEATTTSAASLGPRTAQLAFHNDGPVTFVTNQSGIQVQQARLQGPKTDLTVTGGATLRPSIALDLAVRGNVDLGLLHQIDDDIASEGSVALNATVKGPLAQPAITGRLELKNAAFQTAAMWNGISKANGVIVFTGDVARIESLTAESGGGQVNITGVVSRSGSLLQYDLDARATRVHIRTRAGANAQANATFKLTGTSENSSLAGNVTIQSIGFTSRTDIGSILTQTAAPAETPAPPTGIVAGMRLNVTVRLAPGTVVQTALAENLEAEADLTLRGTMANPGMLGRVVLNQGQLVFFGTRYKVNEGSISFFNPSKIEPNLNLNLATTARGVDVNLNVTGTMENMNLAYQSDPPLPFEEIVGLLATGRMPTSDPILVARQPPQPPQTFQQMGATAVMSTAVTNPVAGQLQRVFGVSQLKIDPTFTSGSELPQARLTLQQQVANNLTFTYVTNLTRSNPQIIRAEWAIDPKWSAIATRQENGLVGVDLFYKRRIH